MGMQEDLVPEPPSAPLEDSPGEDALAASANAPPVLDVAECAGDIGNGGTPSSLLEDAPAHLDLEYPDSLGPNGAQDPFGEDRDWVEPCTAPSPNHLPNDGDHDAQSAPALGEQPGPEGDVVIMGVLSRPESSQWTREQILRALHELDGQSSLLENFSDPTTCIFCRLPSPICFICFLTMIPLPTQWASLPRTPVPSPAPTVLDSPAMLSPPTAPEKSKGPVTMEICMFERDLKVYHL